jgi:hypothetical protein
MRESKYQLDLIKKLEKMFPGCQITKNKAADIQGIPDLTIFYKKRWAMLEVKASRNAPEQPNQAWYVEHYNNMSFARIIFPENEQEVLDALQRSFRSNR